MIINEQILLEIRLSLEKLISEREAMIAENLHRYHLERPMAYLADSFFQNAEQIAALKNELIRLGEK